MIENGRIVANPEYTPGAQKLSTIVDQLITGAFVSVPNQKQFRDSEFAIFTLRQPTTLFDVNGKPLLNIRKGLARRLVAAVDVSNSLENEYGVVSENQDDIQDEVKTIDFTPFDKPVNHMIRLMSPAITTHYGTHQAKTLYALNRHGMYFPGYPEPVDVDCNVKHFEFSPKGKTIEMGDDRHKKLMQSVKESQLDFVNKIITGLEIHDMHQRYKETHPEDYPQDIDFDSISQQVADMLRPENIRYCDEEETHRQLSYEPEYPPWEDA